jgi:D-3-phosphoglycerate dehydrogenase
VNSLCMPVVLCTLPIHPAAVKVLRDRTQVLVVPDSSPETLRRMIGEADVLIVRTKLPNDIFDQPNHLAGVVRHGTGLDFIPVQAATAKGIPVANVPAVNAHAVAEYCISNFLLMSRRIFSMDAKFRDEGWNAARAISVGDSELFGKTVGIVGMGAIGLTLANTCHYGFGMRVIASHPRPTEVPAMVEAVDLETLFKNSDFISLNCPLNDTTQHLVNADRLSLMKSDAVIVNASRGGVIDERALASCLRKQRIKGAALDVFSNQPLSPNHPFFSLSNVILTPHVAALTDESSTAMSLGAARQALQMLAGDRPEHLVNPAVWLARAPGRFPNPSSTPPA